MGNKSTEKSGEKFSSSDKELINRVKNVFRLKTGDKITVLDNLGHEFEVVLVMVGSSMLDGKIIERKKKEEPRFKINLFCSLLKKDNFELVLQKCTELGVFSITPVIYKNTVVKKTENKGRWDKITKEASEQCKRILLPVLNQPTDMDKIFSSVKDGLNLVADEKSANRIKNAECITAKAGSRRQIYNIECGRMQNKEEVNLFIGPEGGFTEEERKTMEENGFLFFRLGDNVLRSETAAIVSVGLLVNLL